MADLGQALRRRDEFVHGCRAMVPHVAARACYLWMTTFTVAVASGQREARDVGRRALLQ